MKLYFLRQCSEDNQEPFKFLFNYFELIDISDLTSLIIKSGL